MTVAFPAVQPTGCSFTPPSFPISSSRSQSGVRSYRVWASKESDAVLEFDFENISQEAALGILEAYREAKGPVEGLNLPPILFNGITDSDLLAFIKQTDSGLTWHFFEDQPPQLQRVPGRRYTTRVTLRAELRFS